MDAAERADVTLAGATVIEEVMILGGTWRWWLVGSCIRPLGARAVGLEARGERACADSWRGQRAFRCLGRRDASSARHPGVTTAPESFAYSGCRMEPALMGELRLWRARGASAASSSGRRACVRSSDAWERVCGLASQPPLSWT